MVQAFGGDVQRDDGMTPLWPVRIGTEVVAEEAPVPFLVAHPGGRRLWRHAYGLLNVRTSQYWHPSGGLGEPNDQSVSGYAPDAHGRQGPAPATEGFVVARLNPALAFRRLQVFLPVFLFPYASP